MIGLLIQADGDPVALDRDWDDPREVRKVLDVSVSCGHKLALSGTRHAELWSHYGGQHGNVLDPLGPRPVLVIAVRGGRLSDMTLTDCFAVGTQLLISEYLPVLAISNRKELQ